MTRRGKCVKFTYTSEDLAKKAAVISTRAAVELGRKPEDPLRAYRCNVCHFWHLTSKR